MMWAVCSACEAEPDLEVDVGFGDAEVAEEVVGHVPAIVLAGVDEEQIGWGMPISPRGERPVNRGDLHEVGAGSRN